MHRDNYKVLCFVFWLLYSCTVVCGKYVNENREYGLHPQTAVA